MKLALFIALASMALAGCDEGPSAVPQKRQVEKAADKPAEKPSKTLCDGECLEVPRGIAGIVFGQKLPSLKKTFGRLRPVRTSKREIVVSPKCKETLKPPGTYYNIKTELGGEKAMCSLLVVDEIGLAGIGCELGAKRAPEEHAEVTWALYKSLAGQYGPGELENTVVNNGRLRARWTSDAATLTLTAKRRGRRSSIHLQNTGEENRHALAVERAGVKARCDARDAEIAASRQERIDRLENRTKKFEDDLRPPLELPKDGAE